MSAVAPLLTMLRDTLDSLVEIGRGHRESATLPGGEVQRVKVI